MQINYNYLIMQQQKMERTIIQLTLKCNKLKNSATMKHLNNLQIAAQDDTLFVNNNKASNIKYIYSNNFHHFVLFYGAIPINIIHGKCPVQFALGIPTRCYVDGKQKLLKVNFTTVVPIKGTENVVTKLVRISCWKECGIHFQEFGF